jgi:hypothetical protein
MKSRGSASFVGGKQFLPTGFPTTDGLQINSPELNLVLRELNVPDREACIRNVHVVAQGLVRLPFSPDNPHP